MRSDTSAISRWDVLQMEFRMEVLKFGGSSLVSAEAMQRVRDVLVARRGTQRIVVCSAMGGVTNALIQIGLKAAQGDLGYAKLLDDLIFTIPYSLLISESYFFAYIV